MKLLTLIDDMDDIYCINNILENIDYVPVSHYEPHMDFNFFKI